MSETEKKSEYYEILAEINKIKCLHCNKELCGTNIFSIKRHYKTVHKINISSKRPHSDSGEDSAGPSSKKRPINEKAEIRMDKNKFLKCCVGLVSIKNLPFRIFDDEEFFKELIYPYEKKFNTKLNSRNIVALIEKSFTKIQESITSHVKNQMISLKFDIATRMNKSILGINIQYIKDSKIKINTLGMIQLNKRHKAPYLKDEIMKCLQSYEIDIKQIYSSTTDNGANMLKVSKFLQELQEEEEDESQEIDGYYDYDDDADQNHYHELLTSVLSVVRCAAYTIQLAAYDLIKTIEDEVNECREIIKKLRKVIREKEVNMKMPILDNATRWNSTYEMLKYLLEMRQEMEDVLDESSLTHDVNWDFVSNFVTALQPLAKCTKQLQSEQYIMGDFYRAWLCCEIELEELFESSAYASSLHQYMQNRKKVLLDNDAFLGALYFDPRFNFENSSVLSEEQKSRAVAHLVKTFELMMKLEQSNPQTQQHLDISNTSTDISFDEPSTSTSTFSKLDQRLIGSVSPTKKTKGNFQQKLMLLSSQQKVPSGTDVLKHWKHADVDRSLRKVAQVALAVPATQVSVERAFSALALIVTKLRSRLGKKNINALLLTKLNFQELRSTNVDLLDF